MQIATHLNRTLGSLAKNLQQTFIASTPKKMGVEFIIDGSPNKDWSGTNCGSRLSFTRAPLIAKNDKIFTMGSCFAREVSYALNRLGFDVFPKYNKIEYDKETQKPFKLALRNHMNHYNTFSIRYEFEHAFENTHYQPDDFIFLAPDAATSYSKAWQDPYRRQIYAASPEAILDLSRKIDKCVADGIFSADVYVITLGLTEVWRNDKNGLYLNQVPHGAEDGSQVSGFTFVQSDYQQNYDNMRWICAQLFQRFPHKRVILTVSPVALKRTYSDFDIVVANTESKSILRAVAGAVSREFSNVVYWPSYEIAAAGNVYESDGRHVTEEAVRSIVNQFVAVHLAH